MHAVTSSQITHVGYDPLTRTLAVKFSSGLYHYHDVTPETYAGLRSASSVGKFVHAHVKPHHKFSKVTT